MGMPENIAHMGEDAGSYMDFQLTREGSPPLDELIVKLMENLDFFSPIWTKIDCLSFAPLRPQIIQARTDHFRIGGCRKLLLHHYLRGNYHPDRRKRAGEARARPMLRRDGGAGRSAARGHRRGLKKYAAVFRRPGNSG